MVIAAHGLAVNGGDGDGLQASFKKSQKVKYFSGSQGQIELD